MKLIDLDIVVEHVYREVTAASRAGRDLTPIEHRSIRFHLAEAGANSGLSDLLFHLVKLRLRAARLIQ